MIVSDRKKLKAGVLLYFFGRYLLNVVPHIETFHYFYPLIRRITGSIRGLTLINLLKKTGF